MTEKSKYLAKTPNQRLNAIEESSDVLSEVLEVVHVRGEQAVVISPEGSQTVSFPEAMPCLHIVEHGEITIQIEGGGDPLIVKANQLALLLQGRAHHVHYGKGGQTIDIGEAMQQSSPASPHKIGVGNSIRCFWGSFSFYGDLAESVLSGLPPIILIRDLKQDPVEWLQFGCQIILNEMRDRRPGANIMVSRLLDLMLIQILRHWARDAETSPGWLASVQDPQINRAVIAIHEDCAYDWSIEALAGLCGMSRSSFVMRFEKVMGQAPGAYLREWRLSRSAKLLRFSGLTIETISERVGYTSKEAFSRAFRKRFGASPSKWRGAA